MTNNFETEKKNNKFIRTAWWTMFIAVIALFIVFISRPFVKSALVNFMYQTIFSKNTVLNEKFLREYQVFFLLLPILAVLAFCISAFVLSMLLKKYKKADWIFAGICLTGVICAVIIPNVSTFNRAHNATYEVQEMVVKDRFVKGFRSRSAWVKLSNGDEARVHFSQYEKLSAGDKVYVVYFEDFQGQTPVVFTKDKYSLPG